MITVEWANAEQNIVLCNLIAPWTWEEFGDAEKKVNAMIDTVDGIVDAILINADHQFLPTGAMSNLWHITLNRHKRYGLSYVVGSETFTKMLLKSLGKVLPEHDIIRFASSEAEAYARIEELQQERRQRQSASPH